MDIRIRPATEDDLDRVVEIHTYAFPDHRGAASRQRQFTANVLGGLADLRVVEQDEVVVGHALLHRLEGWFGGRAVSMGAIESVGIAPECRGQGLGERLLTELHDESFARGDAVTTLYAFRHGFYRRLGYGGTTPMVQLDLDPKSIPPRWVTDARGRLRAIRATDRSALIALYERVAPARTGWLRRPAAHWDSRLLDERRAWFVLRDGRGFVSFTVEQREDFGPKTLVVGELVAEDAEAERWLWGHLGAQRDQVASIEIDTTSDDAMLHALVDPDAHRSGRRRLEHPVGRLHLNGMLRLGSVARALDARGYGRDGALVLSVDQGPHERRTDELGTGTFSGRHEPRATKTYRLVAAEGTGHVTERHSDELDDSQRVRVHFADTAALASVAYGGVRPSHAARAGLLTGSSEAIETADALFAMPSFHALDPF